MNIKSCNEIFFYLNDHFDSWSHKCWFQIFKSQQEHALEDSIPVLGRRNTHFVSNKDASESKSNRIFSLSLLIPKSIWFPSSLREVNGQEAVLLPVLIS